MALLLAVFLTGGGSGQAQGLDPTRNNQVTICTTATAANPSFSLLFSASPLGTALSRERLAGLAAGKEVVLVPVGGKAPRKAQPCYDFFFGPGKDGDRPWNNGDDFHWRWWERYSDEVWDNLAIAPSLSQPAEAITITQAVVRRGGVLLFDSRQSRSQLNDRPVDLDFTPIPITAGPESLGVADLGPAMRDFRRLYHELGDNALLATAYADLGQRDGGKYSPRASGWCSEFAVYAYRATGRRAPEVSQGEISWRVIKSFYQRHGAIYPLTEVRGWSPRERETRIRPGSLVSIVTASGEAHLLLLCQWKHGDDTGTFSAISGNNHGMVWSHAALSLAELAAGDALDKMPARQRRRHQARSFFAVPNDLGNGGPLPPSP